MSESFNQSVVIEQKAFQEAKDPNLCKWAEFYFLAQMSDMYFKKKTGEKPDIIEGVVEKDGEWQTCYLIQKGEIKQVKSAAGEELERVTLGQNTGLVLNGDMEDIIVIPLGEGFVTGRVLNEKFLNQVRQRKAELAKIGGNKYLEAAMDQIEQVKLELEASDYVDLYLKLKEKLVSNYSPENQ
jgi:hypothetical protein